MPAYEVFNDFPRFKKYYKLAVLITGSIAMNKRKKVVEIYKDRLLVKKVKDNANDVS
jgi:hypothetical protein